MNVLLHFSILCTVSENSDKISVKFAPETISVNFCIISPFPTMFVCISLTQ